MYENVRKGNETNVITHANGRMRYWDVSKGIVILLVIMGHLPETPEQVKQAIYTFHMPFFFLANAFFIKHYDVKVHMRKSAKSLLIPYMIVCILEAFCYAIRGNSDVYWAYDIRQLGGNVITGLDMTFGGIFLDKIADMFVGISFTSTRFKEFESVWIVWFLAVLFVAKMLYVGIRHVVSRIWSRGNSVEVQSRERNSTFIQQIVVLVVAILLAMVGMKTGQTYAFLPWSVDVAMACLPFMWMGDYIGNSKCLEKNGANILFGISFLLWLVLSSLGYRGELALRIYPGVLLWMVNAVFGSMVVIGLSKLLSKIEHKLVDMLTWCGSNSIVILGIHCIEHRFFDWNGYVFDRIPILLHWIVIFLVHAIAIVCSAWIVVECRSKVWLLFEKKAGYVKV